MSTWTDVDMYTDSAFCEGAISVHVDTEGFSRSTWIHVDRKTRDIGAQIAPSQKALSAPHCRLPETDAENLCVGGEGGSDPWRETPRREEEGGDQKSFFDRAAVHTRARRRERRCGSSPSKERGFQQQQCNNAYVEAFAWQWYVEEEQCQQAMERDLRHGNEEEARKAMAERIPSDGVEGGGN
ncbi:hypothetical protein Scep_013097 [Stephania cephalantha]|uniref:Uncharacterized protein n=1 Tax=Stephania cephalantha TaxID=152367 RepID=A0AAP0P865_9MAGN